MKLRKHGDLYEVVKADNLPLTLSPNKLYIVIETSGSIHIVNGVQLIKRFPDSPLKPSNGRKSRLADYDEKRSPLKPSNGRTSRLADYSDVRIQLF